MTLEPVIKKILSELPASYSVKSESVCVALVRSHNADFGDFFIVVLLLSRVDFLAAWIRMI